MSLQQTKVSSIADVIALVEARKTAIKKESAIPLVAFLVGMGITGPLALAVLPLSIGTAILKRTWRYIFPPKFADLAPIDSGIVVKDGDMKARKDRKFDILIFGATGFTGKLVVRYMAKTYGVGKTVKWAIAGRSTDKLSAIKKSLSEDLKIPELVNVETLFADIRDVDSIVKAVSDTKVIITTVGPFEKYGSPVVEACAKLGTHYVDITGETGWVQTMLLQWEGDAQKTGAKIVSMCGFDCMPSDLTVMELEDMLPDGESLEKVIILDDGEGSFSGGTIGTLLLSLEGSSRGPPEHPYDPYLKLPDGSKSAIFTNIDLPIRTRKLDDTTGPFVGSYMGFIALSIANASTALRSNALRGRSPGMVYQEGFLHPDWKSAFFVAWLHGFLAIMLTNPITGYLFKRVLPKPGEGADLDDMLNKHFFAIYGYGYGSKGTKTRTALYYPHDAGYVDTARMLAESAMSLAVDTNKLPSKDKGGFFTPSTGMGKVLLNRLIKSGIGFGKEIEK